MPSENLKKLLTNDELLQAVDKIDTAKTIQDLLKVPPEDLGVKSSSYHHFAAVGAFDFNARSKFYAYNLPDEVCQFHKANKAYNADPGIGATFKKGQPIWLSDLPDDSHVVEKDHSKLVKHALTLVGDGLCIPLYGPDNRKGYMFTAFGLHKSECHPIFGYQVQAIAQMLHVHYCLMVKTMHRQINLTGRESEVLELITFGRTNSEIAEELKISANTVAGYVKQVFLKLETNDRVSAAMRAQTIKVAL